MSSTGLEPVEAGQPPRESSSSPSSEAAGARVCPSCGSALAEDQRYCLSCGEPVAPLRLGFLDLLQQEQVGSGGSASGSSGPGGRAPAGPLGLLQRFSGPLALIAIVLLAVVIGLLIGHWTTSDKTAVRPVISLKGLVVPQAAASGGGGAPTGAAGKAKAGAGKAKAGAGKSAGGASTGKSHSGAGTPKAPSKGTPAKAHAKAAPATPKTTTSAKSSKLNVEKLSKSTGKTHAQEIEEAIQSGKPITG